MHTPVGVSARQSEISGQTVY